MRRFGILQSGVICGLLMTLIFAAPLGLAAQDSGTSAPPYAAEQMRRDLFDAQVALMSADSDNALAAVESAEALYAEVLQTVITTEAPEAAARVETAFSSAYSAVENAHIHALVAARVTIWTGVLDGAAQVVYSAIEINDATTAALWLPLRDFRTSTRFSRPDADATLAIKALAEGQSDSATALESVRVDLLDTYQAQLNAALNDAADAQTNGFDLRRIEESSMAAGYFEILAPAYADQRGTDELASAQTAFAELLTAADTSAFTTAYTNIETALAGFRAAPLSDAELARRAGQLTRFIALVPVEYSRAIRDGVVVSDIEIQDALTFHQGATAALDDLLPTLSARDADAATQINALVDQALVQIRAVDSPDALQATIDEATRLLVATLPEEWLNSSTESDIDVILSVLDQVGTAAAQGEYALAESARLEAYALLELGMEQRLRGFAPDMAVYIESLFWQGTVDQPGLANLLAARAPIAEIRTSLSLLNSAFADARLLLDSARSAPGAVAGNAAVIVFREGLEAVLILASLMASLRTAEEKRYRRPLVAGAALALGATIVTWWLAHNLLNVLLPLGERLEAIVSLIAIGVLLLITNWFFHKVYWTGWMANFHAKKRQLVGGVVAVSIGQTLGLVILGFTSIYREGFETVLFLQSLVLEAGLNVVLQGVLLGLLGTSIVGVITFSLQVRLPYKKMLVVTGVMIGFVLLTMVGHTVHVMQSVGWLPITPIQGVFLPYWMGQWFGLFATWQGIILQVAAAAFVIGSYFLAENQQKRQRQRASQSEKNTQPQRA